MFENPSGAFLLLMILLVGQLVVFGTPSLIWGFVQRHRVRELFALRPATVGMMLGATLLAVAMACLATPFLVLQTKLGILPYSPQKLLEQTRMLLPLMQYQPFLSTLLIPIAAASTEEFFFRGALQTTLLRRLPVWPTLWGISLVFALVHMDISGTPFRTILGLLFAWMTFGSRSLWPAMWMHGLYDAILVGMGAWQARSLGTKEMLAAINRPLMGTSPNDLWLLSAAGSVLLVAGLFVTIREHKKTSVETMAFEGNDNRMPETHAVPASPDAAVSSAE